jgi:ectoine hydroxylase-related dioxygenase (phytanoyl-CoA dioxygenase family)
LTIHAKRLEFDTIRPELAQAFAESGVVCVRGLVDRDGIERLRELVEVAITDGKKSAPAGQTYIMETRLASRYQGFRDFVLGSRLSEAAATLMGGRQARLFNDTIFVKEPGAPEPTPWHQDQQSFNLAGRDNCASWLALDPVREASGAMTYVPGSHHWGKEFTTYTHPEDVFDGPAPDIDADPERYPTVRFDLEPGDAVFHHLLTLHKAGPNTTQGTRRRAYSIRFAGDDATWIDRPFATAKFNTPLNSGDPIAGDDFPLAWPAAALR